jgi:hypothetical protein
MACGCSIEMPLQSRKYLKESYETSNNRCNNNYNEGSAIVSIVILSIIFIYLMYLLYSKY